jgi:hypothetical protein
MTRDQVVHRIYEAIFAAINDDAEFLAAIDQLPKVGLRREINIQIACYSDREQQPAPANIAENDAAWLRSLRIDPNLENKG